MIVSSEPLGTLESASFKANLLGGLLKPLRTMKVPNSLPTSQILNGSVILASDVSHILSSRNWSPVTISLRIHFNVLNSCCFGVPLHAIQPKETKPGGGWGSQKDTLSIPFCFLICPASWKPRGAFKSSSSSWRTMQVFGGSYLGPDKNPYIILIQ